MDIRHHAGNPSHIEIPASDIGLAGLALGDITQNRRLPEALVTRIDCKLTGIRRYLDIGVGEDEISSLPI